MAGSSHSPHEPQPPDRQADGASPRQALDLLEAGNARFVAGESVGPASRHRTTAGGGSTAGPSAAFLGCADSRVPIEIVFDQGFGDLFVTRIAGNVAATENIASLEFATQVLGAKVVYVLGHTSCGAVAAGRQSRARARADFCNSSNTSAPPSAGPMATWKQPSGRTSASAQTLVEASTVIAGARDGRQGAGGGRDFRSPHRPG